MEGIEQKCYGKNADVTKTVIKLVNREKARMELTKYIKMINNSVEVTGKDGGPIKHTVDVQNMSDDALHTILGG